MYFCKKEIEKHLGWTPFLIITAISLQAMSTVDVFQKTLEKFYGVFFSRWCLDNRLYNCLIKYSLTNIDYFEEFLSGNPQAFDFQADKTNISSEFTFLKCSWNHVSESVGHISRDECVGYCNFIQTSQRCTPWRSFFFSKLKQLTENYCVKFCLLDVISSREAAP